MNRMNTSKRGLGVCRNAVALIAAVAVLCMGFSDAYAVDKRRKDKSGKEYGIQKPIDARKLVVPSGAKTEKDLNLPPNADIQIAKQQDAERKAAQAANAANLKGPKPVIHAEEPVHDFGDIWIGPDIKHSFTITNKGDKALNISRVKPSCGCTVAGNYPRKIEPGESGQFPFSINSNKLHGRFEKSVTVSSDDPATPDLRLKLRGELKRYVEVTPNTANFGKIIKQDTQERVLNITNNSKKPFEVSFDPPAGSQLKYVLTEKEAGKSYELRIKAEPPFTPGRITESLKLKTNIDEQKELDVVVRATVPDRLDIQPTSIIMPKTAPGKSDDNGVTRVIRFRNYGETPVNVLAATIDDPKVTVTLNERTAGEAYTVTVQMPSGYMPPSNGRTITLKTDDKEKSTISIPLRAPATRTADAGRPKRPAEGMVGQNSPTFTASTTDGKSLNSVELIDQVTVLDFFAVNCGFCKKQLPRLETVRQQFESKGVRFVAVAQTMRKEYTLEETQAKLKEVGFHGELVYDPKNSIGPLFRSTSFPTMVVLGKQGKIDAVNVGNVGDLETRLAGQLNALVMGKELPKVADAAPAAAPKRPEKKEVAGQPAPAFAAKTIEGKEISNAELAKSPATILNFFAYNCGYCKKQIPRLETIRQKYEEKGVRFVNVSQKMRKEFSQEEVVELMKTIGFKGELAIDHQNTIGPKFGASGFPTMVVLGKSGKVEAVNVGNIGDLEQRVPAQLDALIAGKPIPSQYAAKPADNKPRRRPAEDTVGKAAPAFSLKTVDGKDIASADFAKHPATVLNFVAPNCGFCKKQVPNVEKIRAEYEAKGVRFVNVVQTMRKEYTVEDTVDIFKKAGSNLELAKDDGNKVGQMYKATSFPTMVVVGKDGKVSSVNIGAKPNIETLLKDQLDKLIKG